MKIHVELALQHIETKLRATLGWKKSYKIGKSILGDCKCISSVAGLEGMSRGLVSIFLTPKFWVSAQHPCLQ